jgi:hypothetical protein
MNSISDPTNNASCKNCKLWLQAVNGKGEPIYGECHRFPPHMQRVPSAELGREYFPAIFEWVKNWPRPDDNEWCGEFAQR